MNAENADATYSSSCSKKIPVNWENVRFSDMLALGQSHPDWLHRKAQDLGMAGILLKKPDPRIGEAVVILAAQVQHWRNRARALDTPENRTRDRQQVARAIAESMRESFCMPARGLLVRTLKRIGVRAPGDLQICCYDWLAHVHQGPLLRKALGYSERQFRILAGKFCRAESVRPFAVRGGPKIYPWPIALLLLVHRLNRINSEKRTKLALGILFWRRAFLGEEDPDDGFFQKLMGVSARVRRKKNPRAGSKAPPKRKVR